MVNYIILWLSSALLLYLTAMIIPGFKISSFPRALIAALVLGFLNAALKPIFVFLTIPIDILTFGLFTFVINAIILRISAAMMKGFDISGWIPALLGALAMAGLQLLAQNIFV